MWSESAQASEVRWYATHVRVNQEKRVAIHCEGRHIRYFLPVCESVHHWKDRKKRIQSALFPGYLFVNIPLEHSLKVLTIPNVVSLVGSGSRPSPISEREIESLRNGLDLRKVEPMGGLSIGQRVRILSGPFQDREGILVDKKNKRVALSIEVIARQFVVDLSADEIQPVEPDSTV